MPHTPYLSNCLPVSYEVVKCLATIAQTQIKKRVPLAPSAFSPILSHLLLLALFFYSQHTNRREYPGQVLLWLIPLHRV
jgi:hypothetical protein